jgi:hypothetical protein
LQVPWFTQEELPTKEPAPLESYSIGEEISASAPIAIAWSPPGLGKHRRCALAALTANLVLSIWSTDGKPLEASSWDRKLIVNNALTDYFLSNAADEPGHVTSSFCERMRLRTRIRAFTWAPTLPNARSVNTLGSRLSYGQHIVAVCNDDNQLAIVAIDSPASTYGADHGWSAGVLTHVSLTPDSESVFSESTFFDDTIKQQKHISHVSWSPWTVRDDWYHSIIAYATNEDVRARVVTYTHGSIGLGDEVVYPHIDMRYNGPIKWYPTAGEGVLSLALFTASGLIHLTISAQDASIVEEATHDLDGRWDPVSGAIWDAVQRPVPRLHFSSLLSTVQSPTSVLEVSSNELTALGCPSWRDQIENSAVLFSAKNDLKGNTKMKVWGLVTSPLGDFIATCHSVHPSDMIEYGSPNDRRGTVAVSALRQYREMRQGFPNRDVSTEGVLFTLKKLVENTVEDNEQMPTFVEEIAEKLLQAYGPLDGSYDNISMSLSTIDVSNIDITVKIFKQVAFFDPYTLRDRYTNIVSHACNTKVNDGLESILIAYRLAKFSQELPAVLSEMPFSAEIRNHHQKMVALVQSLVESDTSLETKTQSTGAEQSPEHAAPDINAVEPSGTSDDPTHNINLELSQVTVDTCDFCSSPIPFTDPVTASCTNGHQFPRCGLSFLAIQAPGITKYCGICSTPFLSENFVIAQEINDKRRNVVEPANTNGGVGAALDNGTSTQVHINGDRRNGADHESDVSMASDGPNNDQEQHNTTQQSQATAVNVDESERSKIPPITLARVLFFACDACIYCGGKFVG